MSITLFAADQDVLITGGSRGIGAAAAWRFAQWGAGGIHLVAQREGPLNQLAEEIRSETNAKVYTYHLDLSYRADCLALFGVINNVEILVNNAGAIPGGPLETANLEAWEQSWDLKPGSYVRLTRQALEAMKARQGGVIVNVSGNAGARPDAQHAASSMANAMIINLTKIAGSRSLDHGVRVVGVAPGATKTDRVVELLRGRAENEFGDAGKMDRFVAGLPGGRLALPEEIANVIAFAASPLCSRVSGTTWIVDGGESARAAHLDS